MAVNRTRKSGENILRTSISIYLPHIIDLVAKQHEKKTTGARRERRRTRDRKTPQNNGDKSYFSLDSVGCRVVIVTDKTQIMDACAHILAFFMQFCRGDFGFSWFSFF